MGEESPYGPKYRVEITNSSGVAIGDGAQVIQHIHVAAPAPELPPLVELEHLPETGGFVGRGPEIAYFAGQLRSRRLAVITGMPGVGKTWLAAVVAREVAGPDQVFWHRFHEGYRGAEGVEGVVWRLATFLAQHGQENLRQRLAALPIPPFDILIDYAIELLSGRDYLLCFDDYHLVDKDPWVAQLARRLVDCAGSGGPSLIVISRRVPAFARDSEPLGGLSPADTLDLLAARGQTLPAELAGELRICTGGNAQLLMLAINALQECVEPAGLLASLAESEDIEQYLLAEVHKCLSEDERAVMRAVALLVGYGGTRDALEAILDADVEPGILTGLSQRYLLSVSRSKAGRLYGQHAILQAFYYGQLSRRARREMHSRAGKYYCSQEPDALAAARHFERAGEYAHAATILTGDVWAIINQGQGRNLRELFDRLAARELEVGLAVQVQLGRGEVYRLLRETDAARESYARAYALAAPLSGAPGMHELAARACLGTGELLKEDAPETALEWLVRGLNIVTGDDAAELRALRAALLIQAGASRAHMGDFSAARDALNEGLDLLPVGPSRQRASGLMNLANVLSQQADSASAIACYQEALSISQQVRDSWMAVGIRNNLAIEMEIAGDWQGAAAEYQAALTLATELCSRTDELDLELNLGFLATRQGEDAVALAHLTRCKLMAEQALLRLHQVYAGTGLADLYLRQDNPQAAGPLLAEAEALAKKIGARDRLPEIGVHHSLWSLATGDITGALSQAQAAAQLAHDLEMPAEEGMSLRACGQVLRAMDRVDDALAAFEKSHSLLLDCDPYEAARTGSAWGSALVAAGATHKGVALLREAQAIFTKLGARRDLAEAEASLNDARI